MTRRVTVLDYGSGNLRSAQRALERVGAEVVVTADRSAALDADGLVVPGVGAFAACMAGLRDVDGPATIAARLRAGRPYLVHVEPDGAPPTIGPEYATTLTRHVFESFTYHAAVALHVTVFRGRDWHHITEAQYKAVARALRAAVELDPRVQGVPSTKGVL